MEKIKKSVREGKRIIGYYQIGILFPDGKKIIKPKCDLNELFETYFLNLDKLISKEDSAESIYNKYQETYKNKNIKVQINFIDSWAHKWSGKCAWPRKEKFIEYLNKRIYD